MGAAKACSLSQHRGKETIHSARASGVVPQPPPPALPGTPVAAQVSGMSNWSWYPPLPVEDATGGWVGELLAKHCGA